MVNVLVVQDDARIASFIKRGLEANGFAVRTASDGADGLRLTESSDFDLIILDLLLPTVSGEEFLTRLRETGSAVPVIVLTAKDAISDRVANLDAGADDYVTKPFSFAELLARVRARLRSSNQTDSTTISHGRVTIDVLAREAEIEGRSVELTSREFALLETLMHHPGQVLSQPQIIDQVWVTTTTRDPTWSRSTSAISAGSSIPLWSRPSVAPGTDFAGEWLDERRSFSVNDGDPTRSASNGVA
jgi:DNA-binding response OmpR family regulator